MIWNVFTASGLLILFPEVGLMVLALISHAELTAQLSFAVTARASEAFSS